MSLNLRRKSTTTTKNYVSGKTLHWGERRYWLQSWLSHHCLCWCLCAVHKHVCVYACACVNICAELVRRAGEKEGLHNSLSWESTRKKSYRFLQGISRMCLGYVGRKTGLNSKHQFFTVFYENFGSSESKYNEKKKQIKTTTTKTIYSKLI